MVEGQELEFGALAQVGRQVALEPIAVGREFDQVLQDGDRVRDRTRELVPLKMDISQVAALSQCLRQRTLEFVARQVDVLQQAAVGDGFRELAGELIPEKVEHAEMCEESQRRVQLALQPVIVELHLHHPRVLRVRGRGDEVKKNRLYIYPGARPC